MRWYESFPANLGLRVSGMILLVFSFLAAGSLHERTVTTAPHNATFMMLLLAAATFICGSLGSALLVVGPRLWEPVEVAERWRRTD